MIVVLLLASYVRAIITNPGRVPKYDLRSSANNYIFLTEQ